ARRQHRNRFEQEALVLGAIGSQLGRWRRAAREAVRRVTSPSMRAQWWTPVLRPSLLVFASLFVAAVWTALAMRSNERDRFALQTAEVASEWQGRLEAYFERASAPLRALRDQWRSENWQSPERFLAESDKDLSRPWVIWAVW